MKTRMQRAVPAPDAMPAVELEKGSALAPGSERSDPGVSRDAGSQILALTKAQAAESLGISQRKLEQYIGSGELASVKFGRARRVLTSDLAAFAQHLRDETLQAEHPVDDRVPRSMISGAHSGGGPR